MSNAKIISLIAAETRQVRAALAADLYDALRSMVAPLDERITELERVVEDLKTFARAQLSPPLRSRHGTEATQAETDEGKGSTADQIDQGREGQEHAQEAGPAAAGALK